MHKGTVLVVDDDQDLLRVVRLLLEDEGYQIHTVEGDGALDAARALQPGVILLDVRLPGIGGVAISRLLREDPATSHIPIICMAADLAHGIREGMIADEWIAKPFALGRLCEGIARWIGKTHPHAPAAPTQS